MLDRPAGRLNRWGAPFGVALVALLASVMGLANGFVQDDAVLLGESDRLHGLSHWRDLLTGPYWPPPHARDLWRPLTSLLLATEHGFGGGAPWLFRLVSLALFVAVAVLVWRLATRLLPWNAALLAGLLFAAHPVHVEAIALAVGQAELLVALFGMLMLLRYLDRRRAGVDLSARDWVWMGLLYLAACLSKEHGVVLPALVLVAELLIVKTPPRSPRKLAAGFGWLAALGLGFIAVRGMVLGDWTGTFAATPLEGVGIGGRALLMLQVVPRWMRLLTWPFHLQADYSPAEIDPGHEPGLVIAGLLLVAIGVVAAWVARKRAPVVTFGLGWIAIALIPVSNLLAPTGILLAERTLFLPSVGLVILVGAAVAWMAGKTGSLPVRNPGRIVAPLVGAVVLLGWTIRSAARQRAWHDDATFRRESARDAPRSWRTQLGYGSLLLQSSRVDSAEVYYQRALDFAPDPERWKVRNDLAVELFAREETGEAVHQLRLSLSEAPEESVTSHYLVLGLLMLGNYSEAAAAADTAMMRGGSTSTFQELRLLADSAARLGLPPGAIRIRVRNPGR